MIARHLKNQASVSNNNEAESGDDEDEQVEIDPVMQEIVDSVIGEDYLRRLTNHQDLTTVEYLAIKVDLNTQSLLGVEEHLPSLTSLVLDESVIASVRDLGVGYRNLISLSINSCALNDLDGINALSNLKDLSACDNFIVDAASLTMHDNIETLKLSGNNIASIGVADELNSCPNLKSLFLSRNPVEKSPQYRLVISSLITGLEKLDGVPVDRSKAAKVTNSMLLEAADALKLAEEEADDEERLMMDMQMDLEAEIGGNVGGSVSQQQQQQQQQQVQAQAAGGGSPSRGVEPDTGSELTHGSTVVLAGNMAAAMRRRNRPSNGNLGNMRRDGSSGSLGSEQSSPRGGVDGYGGGHDGNGSGGGVSTLDVLDSALRQGDKKQRGGGGSLSGLNFVGEGDVTAMMFPEHVESPRFKERANRHAAQERDRVLASFDPEGSYDGSAGVEELVLGAGNSNRASRENHGGRPSSAGPSALRGSWMSNGAANEGEVQPTTAQSGGSQMRSPKSKTTVQNTPSAVFKIAADATDLMKFKDKINVTAKDSSESKAPVWDTARTSTGHRAEDDGKEEEEEYHSHQDVGKAKSDKTLAMERSRLGPKSSYIHRDMIIRGHDADEEEEAIAVSAEVRHQQASANNSNRSSRPDSGGSKSSREREKSLLTAPIVDPTEVLAGGGGVVGGTVFPTKGAASMAGVSLGFNLRESLAAIDQWVDEMDSDESTSRDGFDDEEDSLDGDVDMMNISHKSLITSYADLTPEKVHAAAESYSNNNTPNEVGGGPVQHPGIQGPFGGHRPSSKSSSRSGSRGSSRADSFAAEQGGSTRILSRDVIISMCHGGERLSSESSEHSNPDLGALGSMDSTAAPVAMTTVEGEMKRALPGGGRGSSSAREDSTFKGLPAKEDNQKQGPPGDLSGLEHDSSPPRVNSEVNLNLGAEQSANGVGVGMSDSELITMLMKKPKAVPCLRTKSAFCDFFSGISKSRMVHLLKKAYDGHDDLSEDDREAKVQKRLSMLNGYMI